jgi:ABC-2 type transport system ATP-binding protein
MHKEDTMSTEYNTETAITVTGLTKAYGAVQALRGVDLQVRRGEIFGFLGPNGAGKTTTIRCLLDLIRPDGGTIAVMGVDPQADPVAVQAATGYLPGELHLEDNYRAGLQLRLLADLRHGRVEWAYVTALAEKLELDLDRRIKNLSKGNKQKIGVIQAMMHRPALLLLDEPTSGLDPIMQQRVLALIREANAAGATIFFSSHVMSEVEALAGRVGIIREGVTVEVADIADLTSRVLRQARVRFAEPVAGSVLADLPNVQLLAQENEQEVTLQIWGDMDEFVKRIAAYPVLDLETERPTLEEAFLAYYAPDTVRPDSGTISNIVIPNGNGRATANGRQRAPEPESKEVS